MRRPILRRDRFAAAAAPVAALLSSRSARGQFPKSRESAPVPTIRGVSAWINSDPLAHKTSRGKVALVHFWANGCSNCSNNLHFRAWLSRDSDRKDFASLGFPAPETPGEREESGSASRPRGTAWSPRSPSPTGKPGTTAPGRRLMSSIAAGWSARGGKAS